MTIINSDGLKRKKSGWKVEWFRLVDMMVFGELSRYKNKLFTLDRDIYKGTSLQFLFI